MRFLANNSWFLNKALFRGAIMPTTDQDYAAVILLCDPDTVAQVATIPGFHLQVTC